MLDNPLRSLLTNIRGTEVVLEAANQNGNKKVVLFSSSEVYGKGASIPFRESDDRLLGPTSVLRWSYAASKAVDEFLALGYYHERRLPVVVVRCFNTCGPRQSPHYGMVIPRFVERALANDPILVYGDGLQSRCFSSVHDVVRGVLMLAEEPKAYGEVFNIGTMEEVSVTELARRIKSLTDSRSEIENVEYEAIYGSRFEDMQRRVPDLAKIHSLVGYVPGSHARPAAARDGRTRACPAARPLRRRRSRPLTQSAGPTLTPPGPAPGGVSVCPLRRCSG